MRRVRRKDTAAELTVRRYLHRRGLRYALHRRDLPGSPDIVLPRRCSVVFVHGCFWHGHDCAHGKVEAKHNAEFWCAKIDENRSRDERKARQLRAAGWWVETVWECEVASAGRMAALARKLLRR